MALKAGPVLDMVHDHSNRYGMDESLFTALKDIFDAIIWNKSRWGVVSPHKFLEILRRENEMFRSAMHQDAHEFLNLLLNQVVDNVEMFSKQHPQMNRAPQLESAASDQEEVAPQPSSVMDTRWVHDLFEGLLTSETRCLTCESTSRRDEPFLDLSVDLAPNTSVTSCLRKFSEEEMLCERNKFHCDNCGDLQEAEKRMKIKRLPRVLALHLKRFKYMEDSQRLQKLFHRVVYPFHLRLFNTTDDAEDPDRLYELYAVVVHIGGGPYHGHYVSIIKTQDRGWLLFDDELVEPVDRSYVLNFFGGEPVPGIQDPKQLACAYVLFYQETTLEAVLREQEMEGQPPTDSRVPAEADVAGSPVGARNGGLFHLHPFTSPVAEEPEPPGGLAHAASAGNVLPPAKSLVAKAGSVPWLPPPKSKKERKAEEKERKAAAKAETKPIEQKRRMPFKRPEALGRQNEQMRTAREAAGQTAAREAEARTSDIQKHAEGKNGEGQLEVEKEGVRNVRAHQEQSGVDQKQKERGQERAQATQKELERERYREEDKAKEAAGEMEGGSSGLKHDNGGIRKKRSLRFFNSKEDPSRMEDAKDAPKPAPANYAPKPANPTPGATAINGTLPSAPAVPSSAPAAEERVKKSRFHLGHQMSLKFLHRWHASAL